MSASKKLIWVGAKISSEDVQYLDEWLKTWGLSGIRGNPPHMTIMYSDYVPKIANSCFPSYEAPVEAKHVGWDVFTDGHLQERCILVMLFKCKHLENRHEYLMKIPGATWDHADGVRPHVSTLRWVRPGFLESYSLPILPSPIHLVGEELEIWEEPVKPLQKFSAWASLPNLRSVSYALSGVGIAIAAMGLLTRLYRARGNRN